MKAPRQLAAALAAATIFASVFGTAAVYAASGDPSQWGRTAAAASVTGDPSQWGRSAATASASASKINEYEGQHRATLAAGGSKNGDVPVVGG